MAVLYDTVPLSSFLKKQTHGHHRCCMESLNTNVASLRTYKVAGHHFSVTGVLSQECAEYLAEHRLRDKAAGKPVVTVPLVLYTDDTSGRTWHLFNSWSIRLAGLPRSHNSQLGNIHFVCCSDSVCLGHGRTHRGEVAGPREGWNHAV